METQPTVGTGTPGTKVGIGTLGNVKLNGILGTGTRLDSSDVATETTLETGITGAVPVGRTGIVGTGTLGRVGIGALGRVGIGTLGRVGIGTLGRLRLGKRLDRREVAPEMMLERGILGSAGVAVAETLTLGRGTTLVTREVGIGVASVGVGSGIEMLGMEMLGMEMLGTEMLGTEMLGTEMLGTVTLGRPVGRRPETMELMTETTLEMGMGATVGVATAELFVSVCVCLGITAAAVRPAKSS